MCLLGLSVLRFLEDFQLCVRCNPVRTNDTDEPNSHLLLLKVELALRAADISHDIFQQWQKDVKAAFTSRNGLALSLSNAPAGMSVDSRGLLERMHHLEAAMSSTCAENSTTRDIMSELLATNKQILARVNHLESLLSQSASHGRIPSIPPFAFYDCVLPSGSPETHTSPDQPANPTVEPPQAPTEQSEKATDPSPFPGQRRTTACYDQLLPKRYGNKAIPVAKLFSSWFVEQLPIAYENYKLRHDALTPSTADEILRYRKYHRSIKTHFSVTKTAVHVVLKNIATYPTPQHTPQMLEELANQALEKMVRDHKLQSKPTRTSLAGKSSSLFHTGGYGDKNCAKQFPPDTPDSVQKYFNTRGIQQQPGSMEESNPDLNNGNTHEDNDTTTV